MLLRNAAPGKFAYPTKIVAYNNERTLYNIFRLQK